MYSLETSDALSEALAQFVVKAQDEVLEKRDSFKVAVSGGSLPKLLGQHLTGREGMKWEKWSVTLCKRQPKKDVPTLFGDYREVFFADERVVPLDHEDSNYRLVKEFLLDKVSIPADKVHTINPELLNDPEAAAEDYEQKLMSSFVGKNAVAFPKFDLLLLGMGPDGLSFALNVSETVVDSSIRPHLLALPWSPSAQRRP